MHTSFSVIVVRSGIRCYSRLFINFRLDASIYQHVSKHNSELLSQTVDLENFSNIVGSVESRIRSVSNDVNRIKQRLSKPYEFLSNQVTQIRRMGLLCDVLRHVLRISTTTKKLLGKDKYIISYYCIE